MLGIIASGRRNHGPRQGSVLPRRALVAGGCAAAVACTLPRVANAATAIAWPSADSSRRFSVFHDGARIGTHTILHSSATGEVRVSTDVRLLAKVAFLTVFRFIHHSTEVWRAGQLMSMTSETLEHGETLRVDGTATPQGFRVVSKDGPFIAPTGTLTSNSLWTPAVLEQTSLIDADEAISVDGRRVEASRYSFITPYLAGNIWYDSRSLWVRGDFERDGSKVQYQLDT
jgi:hypothetical protein